MLNYIVQVILFQAVFLAIYDLVLKKETFFQWNRLYLVATSLLAFILPFLKSQTVSQSIPQEFVVMLPEIVLRPSSAIENNVAQSSSLMTSLEWIYYLGLIASIILFSYKIIQLFNMIRQNKIQSKQDHKLVVMSDNCSAFSFFKYVFIGKEIQRKKDILSHELVHVKQRHSLDLLLFEIQKIVLWFNPFSYLYQKRVSEVHEFIADAKVISKQDRSTYFQGILAEVFQIDKFAFVNSFYKKSIIKKRIIMLGKNKSKEILKLKYLIIIPMLSAMLIYTSCEPKTNKRQNAKKMLVELMEDKVKNGTGTKEELKFIQELPLPDSNEFYMDDVNKDKAKEFLEVILKMNRGVNDSDNDYSDSDDVPFAIIESPPVFPGCDENNVEDQKKCFMIAIQKEINSNFNLSFINELELESGKAKVYVHFTINKTGNIVDIKARAPHKKLEKEAIRVVSNLPQMQAGEHNGKKVSVKYTLPIVVLVD